jgi:hypothetical protein
MGMRNPRWRPAAYWTCFVTVAVEALTATLRFSTGKSITQVSSDWPIWLRTHHMFWGALVLVASFMVWGRNRLWAAIFGIGLGLILSDAIHHLIVLPLTVGDYGWHWP